MSNFIEILLDRLRTTWEKCEEENGIYYEKEKFLLPSLKLKALVANESLKYVVNKQILKDIDLAVLPINVVIRL